MPVVLFFAPASTSNCGGKLDITTAQAVVLSVSLLPCRLHCGSGKLNITTAEAVALSVAALPGRLPIAVLVK